MKSAKIAFSVLNGRIAPVFDTASNIVIVEVEDSKINNEETNSFNTEATYERIECLKKLGVSEIVCGAISRAVQEQIELNKIIVTPFISGEFPKVRDGWLCDELSKEVYIMPGCCGRRKGRGRACITERQVNGRGFGRKLAGGSQGNGSGNGLGRGQGNGLGRGLGYGTCINQERGQRNGLGNGFGNGLGRGLGNGNGRGTSE